MSQRRLNEIAIKSELTRSAFFEPNNRPTAQKAVQIVEQPPAQKLAQLSRPITTDAVETLDFNLRKVPKSKLNTNIPVEWKEEMDRMALDLKVGKYELAAYLIGQALKKVP